MSRADTRDRPRPAPGLWGRRTGFGMYSQAMPVADAEACELQRALLGWPVRRPARRALAIVLALVVALLVMALQP